MISIFVALLHGALCGILPTNLKCRRENILNDFPIADREQLRIIEGTTAEFGAHKWLVHLEGVRCGGVIIGANWVLTSAKCCAGKTLEQLFTVANDWDADVYYDSETVHRPDKIIIHEKWDPVTDSDNICLLHFDNDHMVINGVLDADIACLPEADVKLEKPQNCVVAGWGWSGSSFENQLQEKLVRVIPDEVCPRFDANFNKYTAAHCSGTGACVGDFGGPLICAEKNSKTGVEEPVVRGIMSHTKGCKNKPMIYTDTQGYLEWIRQKTAVIAAQDSGTRPTISPTTTDRPLTAAPGEPLLPSGASCQNPIDGITRIVGGQTAKNGEWDWIVQFPQIGCGGSVIAKNWVLTAAHCCKPFALSQLMTNFGDHNIGTSSDSNFLLRPILKIVHPQWNSKTFDNDVCLLKYSNIPYSDRVAPVCMPKPWDEEIKPGQVCYVAGWGKDHEDSNKLNNELKEAAIMGIDPTLCNSGWGLSKRLNPNTMICAGDLRGGTDSCQGDSGKG